jgi:hypothetical protein
LKVYSVMRKCCKIHDMREKATTFASHSSHASRFISRENMRSEMYARNWAQGRLLAHEATRWDFNVMSQNFASS